MKLSVPNQLGSVGVNDPRARRWVNGRGAVTGRRRHREVRPVGQPIRVGGRHGAAAHVAFVATVARLPANGRRIIHVGEGHRDHLRGRAPLIVRHRHREAVRSKPVGVGRRKRPRARRWVNGRGAVTGRRRHREVRPVGQPIRVGGRHGAAAHVAFVATVARLPANGRRIIHVGEGHRDHLRGRAPLIVRHRHREAVRSKPVGVGRRKRPRARRWVNGRGAVTGRRRHREVRPVGQPIRVGGRHGAAAHVAFVATVARLPANGRRIIHVGEGHRDHLRGRAPLIVRHRHREAVRSKPVGVGRRKRPRARRWVNGRGAVTGRRRHREVRPVGQPIRVGGRHGAAAHVAFLPL